MEIVRFNMFCFIACINLVFHQSFGEVTFLQEPYSAVICPGSTFVFSCSYTGSSSLPEWIINKLRYNFNQVPHPHILRRIPNGYLLELQNVNILMNATSYQCSVQGILSNLVFLYIELEGCHHGSASTSKVMISSSEMHILEESTHYSSKSNKIEVFPTISSTLTKYEITTSSQQIYASKSNKTEVFPPISSTLTEYEIITSSQQIYAPITFMSRRDRKDETYLTSAYYINNTVNNTEVTSRGELKIVLLTTAAVVIASLGSAVIILSTLIYFCSKKRTSKQSCEHPIYEEVVLSSSHNICGQKSEVYEECINVQYNKSYDAPSSALHNNQSKTINLQDNIAYASVNSVK